MNKNKKPVLEYYNPQRQRWIVRGQRPPLPTPKLVERSHLIPHREPGTWRRLWAMRSFRILMVVLLILLNILLFVIAMRGTGDDGRIFIKRTDENNR